MSFEAEHFVSAPRGRAEFFIMGTGSPTRFYVQISLVEVSTSFFFRNTPKLGFFSYIYYT